MAPEADVATLDASPVHDVHTDLPPAAAPVKKRNFGRIIEQTWIWSIVGYSLLRFVVAWGAFGEHGANVWIFGILDVGTAWPYAKSVAAVCKRSAASQWSTLPGPLAVALATFFAPYAYLWFSAGEMPGGLRVGMAVCVGLLLAAAATGVVLKARRIRRDQTIEAALTEATGNEQGAAPDELIIDLRHEPATIH